MEEKKITDLYNIKVDKIADELRGIKKALQERNRLTLLKMSGNTQRLHKEVKKDGL